MNLGAPAAAPQAFLEFCSRQPRDCQVSREMVLSQMGTTAGRHRELPTASASISQPKVEATRVTPAIARMTMRSNFQFRTDPSERVNWLSLLGETVADEFAATPVGQAKISFVHFKFEAPAPDPTPAPAAETAPSSGGATLMMDSNAWATVNRVNTKVNREIIRRTDIDNYGVEERWSTPLEDGTKFGDCEDFALEKRRALIAEGFPPSALSIAVVTTAWNASHAVLLVAGERGEYVLDNLSPWVVPWNEAPYTFVKRQVAGDAFRWVRVDSRDPVREQVRALLIARAD
ncbi:transglutaminase-like cysteine peptidase [Phenylobacterium sp.]|uniref:transglutaminase-like cysteine peptidase n=1 Tax=Phenylobacterium sp. TaxID=1871053 RepID=UPI0030F3B14C